jgi:hypothetical protein
MRCLGIVPDRWGRVACTAAFAATFLLVPIRLEAQYGVKLGLSLGTQEGAGADLSTRTGFAAGVSFPLRPSRILQVQPEVLYVEKGWEGGSEPRLQYLEFPVFLRVNAPTTGVVPWVLAGPSLSVRLACNQLVGDCPMDSRRTDYGMAVGGGVRFGGLFGITAEGRYTWGLRNVDRADQGLDSATRAFLLMVGVEFD